MEQGNRRRLAHGLGASLLVMSFAGLMLFGIVHLARTHGPGWDLAYFHVAGDCWLEGETPYNPATYTPRVAAAAPHTKPDQFFAYPPMAAPLMMGLASLPDAWRYAIWTGINLLATLGLAAVLAHWVARRDAAGGFLAALGPWVAGALILASPYTWDAFSLGQTMPVVLLSLVAGWLWACNGKPWSGGALLGVAMIKPTLMVLPVVWLVLERRWRPLIMAAGVCAALVVYPVLLHGPIEPFAGWFQQIQAYQTAPYNQYGSDEVIAFGSFIAAIGGPMLTPGWVLGALVVAVVIAHGWLTRREPLQALAMLLAVFVGLVYAHRYDLMMLSVAGVAAWPYLRLSLWRLSGAAALLAMIWLPERVLMLAGELPPLVLHYRSAAVGLAAIGAVGVIGFCGRSRPALRAQTIVPAKPVPEPINS